MIKTAEMHVESLRGYSKPLSKISRMAAGAGVGRPGPHPASSASGRS